MREERPWQQGSQREQTRNARDRKWKRGQRKAAVYSREKTNCRWKASVFSTKTLDLVSEAQLRLLGNPIRDVIIPSFRGKKGLMLDNSRMTIHYHSSCHIYSLRSNIYEAVVHYGRKTVCRGLIDWACNVIDRSIKADRSVNNLPVCKCVFVRVCSPQHPYLELLKNSKHKGIFPPLSITKGEDSESDWQSRHIFRQH